MVCMIGHVLDDRRDSYACCFPLWVCGVDACMYLKHVGVSFHIPS